MTALRQIRSCCYALARLLGWLNAAERGPRALGKRALRVGVYRRTGRAINRLLK